MKGLKVVDIRLSESGIGVGDIRLSESGRRHLDI